MTCSDDDTPGRDHAVSDAAPGGPVVVRIAPSPTGRAHVGTARTALFNWLFARRHGGRFLCRIEDTDQARNDERHVADIFDGLAWLGLDFDDVSRQSANADAHRAAVAALLDSGHAYWDANTPEQVAAAKAAAPGRGYRGRPGRPGEGAVMLRMPQGAVCFYDELRGTLSVDAATVHDQVLARADASALYNLAVVVDDHDSAVTHVIRGDDHISNTFKQVAIARALGYPPARYAHLPLVHDEHGRKYSKRHQAPSVLDFRDEGYTAQTMRNALALLGWGPRDNQELLSDQELVSRFDLADCGTQAARLDPAKIRWISGQKLRALPAGDYAAELARFAGRPLDDRLRLAAAGTQEKASTLQEAWQYVAWAFDGPADDSKAWRKTMKGDAAVHLAAVRVALEGVPWTQPQIADALARIVPDGVGPGKVYQPLRVALSGSTVTTAIEHTVCLAGRELAIERITAAVARLS